MIEEIGAHSSDGRPMLLVETREEWRAWLERNHGTSPGVWLVSWKKATGKPYVPYGDTVDEALCFGWIDSRVNTLDDERAMRLFTRRNPKSPWSRINKEKAARLMQQARMTEAGASMIAAAQSNGAWTMYDEIEDLVIPPDLASALAANQTAQTHFDNFSPSSRKNILWWIKSARKPETRAARIARTAELAAGNRMANHPAGRDRGPA
ncbi:MAG: YdeI/OmpD-associated family protein [Chloroflexota bacterium]|nr:YdeI/OmpD-associated family protein [Chloroflexota bacterium]MDE2684767.1 YdeI/OmpD-associated family protein [Chloroflexota bacterium]